MAIFTASLQRNLSRLELAISILIIAILMVAFMRYLDAIEVSAERATFMAAFQDMQTRVMELRVLGGLESNRHIGLSEFVRRVGRGDMQVFVRESAINWAEIEPGQFVFALDERMMIYRVRAESSMNLALTDPGRVRIKITPVFDDANNNGRFDDGRDTLRSARLELIDREILQ
ncbi:MAG: hypothetical protein AAF384_01600 [Pseudomonadota bacterium]